MVMLLLKHIKNQIGGPLGSCFFIFRSTRFCTGPTL
jgi:hypothetical protein